MVFIEGEIILFRWGDYYRIMVASKNFDLGEEVEKYVKKKGIKTYAEVETVGDTLVSVGSPIVNLGGTDLFIDSLEKDGLIEQLEYYESDLTAPLEPTKNHISEYSSDRIHKERS